MVGLPFPKAISLPELLIMSEIHPLRIIPPGHKDLVFESPWVKCRYTFESDSIFFSKNSYHLAAAIQKPNWKIHCT